MAMKMICLMRNRSSLLIVLFLSSFHHSTAQAYSLPDAAPGLAYGFYRASCPNAVGIVRSTVQSFLAPNISQAGSLLRLPFHDCFVQGCDASLLLNDIQGEQSALPNLTLRPQALALIEQIKENLEASCPNTVSCADIIVMAARDATHLAGGPYFKVPTGRLDSLGFANSQTILSDLPRPTDNITTLLDRFTNMGLNKTDLVSLSGAHTIGLAHCSAFKDAIYPMVQSGVDASFAQKLLQVCPNTESNQETMEDMVTPNVFDNQYYKNMLNGEVLFDSDRALLNDETTGAVVSALAANENEFFHQFARSFIKMSMVGVKTAATGNGNVRKVCSILNPGTNNTVSGVSAVAYASHSDMLYERS